MADTNSTNEPVATPRLTGYQGRNPPPTSKPYIHSRYAYNPFGASNQEQNKTVFDPQESAVDKPAFNTVPSPASSIDWHAMPLVEPKQIPAREVHNRFSFWGFIKGIFSAIWHFLGLIRNTVFTALIILILAVVGIILILLYKPPIAWNPLKTYLNDGVDFPATAQIQSATIYSKINKAALNNQAVDLNNNELTQLFRDYTQLDDKCIVTIHQDGMRFYLNIDTKERPLWLIVDTDVNQDQKFTVTRVGFGRFTAPHQLASLLNDTLGQVFQFLEKQVTSDSAVGAVNLILDHSQIDKNLLLNQVEFNNDMVVLSYQNNSAPNSNSSY